MSDATEALREYEHTKAAFDTLKAEKLDEIMASAPADSAHRETLYCQIKALDEVQNRLLSMASGAHLEAHLTSLAEAGYSA